MKRDGAGSLLDDGTHMSGTDVASLEAALEAVRTTQERLAAMTARLYRLEAVAAFLQDEADRSEAVAKASRSRAAQRAAQTRKDRSWWVLQ